MESDPIDPLRLQSVTSSWGGRRHAPYAFTEQGVAMLSGVLNSSRAMFGEHRDHARVCKAERNAGEQ